jgi:hypothetical protein
MKNCRAWLFACVVFMEIVHTHECNFHIKDQYLGLHLDRRLTWHKHIFAKRKQLGITLTKLYCLLRHKSKLSASNKLLIYKTILKPIRTYGIQLWSRASTCNIEILESFQSKALCTLVRAEHAYPKGSPNINS